MARGNGTSVKGSNRKTVKDGDHDSEESDEEYRATEDEDCEESDEFYTLDGDESEEIIADFGESTRVSRSRNVRRSSSKKVKQVMKPRKRRKVVSYKGDNQEEEDENDAEFQRSESDFIDDEDKTPKVKKNDRLSRSHLRGGQKKCKKSKLKNPTTPNQSNHRSGQMLRSSKEKSVTNKIQSSKNRNKIYKRRKPREVESESDHEFTISKEEREQVRDKFKRSSCGNKQHHPAHEQRKNPVGKGKEKVEDTKDDVGKQVCGICLSEEGKRTVRGVLNCCQHYFCFACIMEWSKVESRCPLCKQRFATITKAARSDKGFGSRATVIPVPECDQVYEPSEEELRGYLDPYESVICTECHYGGDDALMLLCDICDSSAHTYCVGLGREVPEGNWYCEGCRPNSNIILSSNATGLSSPVAVGFDLNELYVPETPLTQETRAIPEPMPAPVGNVAATLRDRRRTHRQIHHHFLNNNRMGDSVGRSNGTSASSSGIRLFGSRLDQVDHIFPSQNSDFACVDASWQDDHRGLGMGMRMGMSMSMSMGTGLDSRLGYAQLHPCTNRSSMMVDAFREVMLPSRASQGGRHTPF